MATTHKLSPRAIARQVIADNRDITDLAVHDAGSREILISAIMLGIAAYNDASNQRPENLSEACDRLGVNLHWKLGRDAITLIPGTGRYFVFYGLGVPLAEYDTEEQAIAGLEETLIDAERFRVNVWMEAML